jgi:hypothetical protein
LKPICTPSRALPTVFVPSASTFSSGNIASMIAATRAACGLDWSHQGSSSRWVPQLTCEMSKSSRMLVPPHVMLGDRHVPLAETCWHGGAPAQQQYSPSCGLWHGFCVLQPTPTAVLFGAAAHQGAALPLGSAGRCVPQKHWLPFSRPAN